MSDKELILHRIRSAFRTNEYPGDAFLQGSGGCEAYEEVGSFRGRANWGEIDPSLLDAHATALNFFSEAGLRFFLPAYLIADVEGKLKSADPVFILTHGFSDLEVTVQARDRNFAMGSGKSELINPRRYGAATFYDYVCYRLSIFTREEAQAIVAYLEYKRDTDPRSPDGMRIDAALNGYWRERAAKAPAAASLQRYLREKSEWLAAIQEPKKAQ